MSGLPPAPHEIWREFHWAFFVDVQGLILCFGRFARMLDLGDMARAEVELEAAAELMQAAGAAMRLAGSFAPEDYQSSVRASMTPPNVASSNFSGLMSWEHGTLVRLWRDLRGRFATLPEALAPAHGRFVEAYRSMADSHVHVCARFAGAEGRSLRYGDRGAIRNLERFGQSRLSMINPARTDPVTG